MPNGKSSKIGGLLKYLNCSSALLYQRKVFSLVRGRFSLRLMYRNSLHKWNAVEKRVWCAVLFVGCMCLYMSRNSLPLCLVQISSEVHWDKHQSGVVLSSFYWGYLATQVLGGWLADQYGGEHVLWMAACVWSILTCVLPYFVDHAGVTVILLRVAMGAFQGVHYPAFSSLLTAHVKEQERSVYFGVVCAGAHIGTVFSGSVVGILTLHYGWPSVFKVLGILGLLWALMVKVILGSAQFGKWSVASSPAVDQQLTFTGSPVEVPWRAIFTTPSILAIFVAHTANLFFFNVLINWLPTYFHETFPSASSSEYYTIPWMSNAIASVGSGYVCNHWLSSGSNLTTVRKIMVGISLFGPAVGLYVLTYCSTHYVAAVLCVSFIALCHGASSAGTIANPSDVAPEIAGSVFGIMNMLGALEGLIAVYMTGHILHSYSSWSAVWLLCSGVALCGGAVFMVFGSAKRAL